MGGKHSIDFKLSMIQEYLNGNLGYHSLSAKHGIDTYLIRTWVNQFNQNGAQGLIAGMTRATYSDTFKLTVLHYRSDHKLSYRGTANAFDTPNPSTVTHWQAKFNQYGIVGLESKSKGRRAQMNQKPSKKKQNQPASLNETYKQDH
ncbi:helix-turn-helix domain-containing protein [Salinicoccus roseus]|uniref:Transposase n=1 Tax=Salinicoccus roseus TaxID=45670 RepID=A0ABT4YK87_9STAP|nr:helix-turn-helix domain-containing protein [Salinicoccus roseus]MCG7333449.1 transposase [Salinicoccus roseus]MDB0581256.1 transposase [Salinicoccus roseus]